MLSRDRVPPPKRLVLFLFHRHKRPASSDMSTRYLPGDRIKRRGNPTFPAFSPDTRASEPSLAVRFNQNKLHRYLPEVAMPALPSIFRLRQ